VPLFASYVSPPSVFAASDPVAESNMAMNDVVSVLSTTVTVLARVAVAALPPILSPLAVPVMFVPTRAEGVPSAGVTSVGEVPNTRDPDPVSSVMRDASFAEVSSEVDEILLLKMVQSDAVRHPKTALVAVLQVIALTERVRPVPKVRAFSKSTPATAAKTEPLVFVLRSDEAIPEIAKFVVVAEVPVAEVKARSGKVFCAVVEVAVNVEARTDPSATMLPVTESFSDGVVEPTPTLPVALTKSASVFPARTRSGFTVEPVPV